MKRLLHQSAASLAMAALLSGCSPQAPVPSAHESPAAGTPTNAAPVSTGPARFTIVPTDVAGIAEVSSRSTQGTPTNGQFVIHLQFTDAKAEEFRQFTREHVNQRVQLMVGRIVMAEPVIAAEISNGQADLSFATAAETQAVLKQLGKPKYRVYTSQPASGVKTNQ